MKAAREIDVLIAERIFGAKVTHLNQKSGYCIDYVADKDKCNDPILTDYGSDGYRLKYYSTDVSSAWEIVDQLILDGWRVETNTSKFGGTTCQISCAADRRSFDDGELVEAISAPRAICLAALSWAGRSLKESK